MAMLVVATGDDQFQPAMVGANVAAGDAGEFKQSGAIPAARIPIAENVPLARAPYATLEVDEESRVEHLTMRSPKSSAT
jgi:hypothetical protein